MSAPPAFGPKSPNLVQRRLHAGREALRTRWVKGPWSLAAFEFVSFGIKQAWACLFGGAMLGLLLATFLWYPDSAPVSRYDFLVIGAVLIQVLMVWTGLETLEEAKVILVFHITGTVMELFKTAHGSWIYPEESVLRIGAVPLFTGFMYAAVGSYLARVWRIFDFRFDRFPPLWGAGPVGGGDLHKFLRPSLAAGCPDRPVRGYATGLRAVPRLVPAGPASPADAAGDRLSARRAVYLVFGEYRHLRPGLGLSRAGRRLAPGLFIQTRIVVSADDHQFRPGRRRPSWWASRQASGHRRART